MLVEALSEYTDKGSFVRMTIYVYIDPKKMKPLIKKVTRLLN